MFKPLSLILRPRMSTGLPDDVGDPSYRALFDEKVPLAALRVMPKDATGIAMKHLRGCLYVHRGVRNVVDSPDGEDAKVLLLSPDIVAPPSAASPSAVPTAVAERIAKAESEGDAKGLRISLLSVPLLAELTYRNFTMPEILKRILPSNVVALSGFEQVGHIAHVNLSAEHIPFQFKIGQVIIDTNSSVSTVVNKVDSISSVFREFKMEVIGGPRQAQMVATVRQHGLLFHVPYDKVYWNSRLGEEHERLARMLNKGDELFDVMAGVGPFAVRAALRGASVHANDLNPASYESLQINARTNGATVAAYNMDGRDFLETVRRDHLEKCILPAGNRRHATMNLPALAVSFLDVFRRPEWMTGAILDSTFLVHCYTFSAAKDPCADAVKQVEQNLHSSLVLEDGRSCVEEIHLVRDVAPTKQMVCVSFRLPPSLTQCRQPVAKRLREDTMEK
jgi:tRNA (guanine37-N1)-methyltransferase